MLMFGFGQRQFFWGLVLFVAPATAKDPNLLRVPLVNQGSYLWCWAAVGEMVTTYYSNYSRPILQCSFVAKKVDNQACCPSGGSDDCAVTGTPHDLQGLLKSFGFREPKISTAALDWDGVNTEIDQKGPFVVVLNGVEQHMVLITGHVLGRSDNFLVVNDPDPVNGTTYMPLTTYQSRQTVTMTGLGQ
jgi:papain like cysteine protease AvrRpt2